MPICDARRCQTCQRREIACVLKAGEKKNWNMYFLHLLQSKLLRTIGHQISLDASIVLLASDELYILDRYI